MSRLVPTARSRWEEDLMSLGFDTKRPAARHRSGKTELSLCSGWAILRSARTEGRPDPSEASAAPEAPGPLRGNLSRPGLWKPVSGGAVSRPGRVFELPPSLVPGGDRRSGGGEIDQAFRDIVLWALATEAGGPVEGWIPPEREEVREWIPDDGLTVQTGPVARQGALVHDPARLALSFELLPCTRPDLTKARKRWLEELLIDAQDRWRMVRIGMTDESAVVAEIDLTGAPEAVAEPLVRISLDALRWFVQWIVQPVEFVALGTGPCRALDSAP
jgi:hypothetical protein